MIGSVFLASDGSVEYLDIVTKVDSFYNSAWTKLIWVLGAFFTVLAILGPLFLNWYQKRRAEYEQEKIEDNLKKYIDEKFKENQKKVDKELHKNIGMIMHVQGNVVLNQYPYEAINCYFYAIKDYLKANDSQNVGIVLKSIYNYINKEEIKREDINTLENYFNISIINLIEEVSKETDNHVRILNKLRYVYKEKMKKE